MRYYQLSLWKQGVHLDLASKLNCKAKQVTKAIDQLIANGRRYQQKDGVVYDSNGAVLAIDRARIPCEATMTDVTVGAQAESPAVNVFIEQTRPYGRLSLLYGY